MANASETKQPTTAADVLKAIQDMSATQAKLSKQVSQISDSLKAKDALEQAEPLPVAGSSLSADIVQKLNEPLPTEAVTPHPTSSYLSVIKTIYIIERLNQVFGLDGWYYDDQVIENDPGKKMIIVKVTVTMPKYGIVRSAYGGNDNNDRGDAYKGAVTDALSKIGGMLGVGMDVYKGFGPTMKKPGRDQQKTSAASSQTAAPVVVTPCDDCKGTIKTITVSGDPYGPEDLIRNSQKNYKLNLCGECQRKRRQTRSQSPVPAAADVQPEAQPANGAPAPVR